MGGRWELGGNVVVLSNEGSVSVATLLWDEMVEVVLSVLVAQWAGGRLVVREMGSVARDKTWLK